MPFVILPTNSASGGYEITNSLRFNSGSSDYLNRTPASAGSRTAWTWSSWVKRSELSTGSAQVLFGAYLTGSDSGWLEFGFDSDNTANWTVQNVGGNSTSVYRDVSAWYHYLMNYDGTASGLKLYINGSQVTISNTSSISGSLGINSASSHRIGRSPNTAVSRQFGGYLADTYFIDGSTLTPSSFGETDFDTGIWKPKAYTGTYGTNGFYLQFKNSASLGTDSSGNGNTFTVNNLTSIDQTTDTPTNNWNTLNPLLTPTSGSAGGLSDGNLTHTANYQNGGTFFLDKDSTGKWYWECKVISGANSSLDIAFGFSSDKNIRNDGSSSWAVTNTLWLYSTDGSKYNGSWTSSAGATFTNGDIIGMALDLNGDTITFYKNGVSQFTIYSLTISGTAITPWIQNTVTGCVVSANFGNPTYTANGYTDGAGKGNFSYSVPSGYFALCTANLSLYG